MQPPFANPPVAASSTNLTTIAADPAHRLRIALTVALIAVAWACRAAHLGAHWLAMIAPICGRLHLPLVVHLVIILIVAAVEATEAPALGRKLVELANGRRLGDALSLAVDLYGLVLRSAFLVFSLATLRESPCHVSDSVGSAALQLMLLIGVTGLDVWGLGVAGAHSRAPGRAVASAGPGATHSPESEPIHPADFSPDLRNLTTRLRPGFASAVLPVHMRASQEVHMRTLAIVSQKGGAGKTTLAVNLAAEAARMRVTLILDTDPQATASRWSEWRGGGDPEVIDCGAPSLLAGKLAKAAELGAEVAVIDTPPHADAMARQAARLADLILIPCRPRAFDLAAIEATAELVRSSARPAFLVFNAGPPRGPLVYREAAELITRAFGLPVAPVILPERAAFHHSAAAGRTAPEFDAGGKAAAEIQALWTWTCEQLGLSTCGALEVAG